MSDFFIDDFPKLMPNYNATGSGARLPARPEGMNGNVRYNRGEL